MLNSYSVKVVILLTVCVSSIIVSEILLRYLYPQYDPSGFVKFEYNKKYKIRLGRKNFSGMLRKHSGDYEVVVDFNHYGFRDYKDIKNINKEDFTAVGDSFSFGWGVSEERRYSNLLENYLKRPVYNISISNNLDGYRGLMQYAELHGAKINNLILGFTMENDFIYPGKYMNSERCAISFKYNYSKFKNYLSKNAIYNILVSSLHQNKILRDNFIKSGLIIDNLSGIPVNNLTENDLLDTMNAINQIDNAYNLLIFIIPSRGLWAGRNTNHEKKIHESFIKLLDENKINYIDLKPIFEINRNPLSSYHFKNDGHWNEEGHRVASVEIFKYIKNNCDLYGSYYCNIN